MSDFDVCTFCDGEGREGGDDWPCSICRGTGWADTRLMEFEWACTGSGRAICATCKKLNYQCECYEDEVWD